MATASLQGLVASQQERDLVRRVVWKLFNAEKDNFKVKVFGFISIDLSDKVRSWITSKFGPEPLGDDAVNSFTA